MKPLQAWQRRFGKFFTLRWRLTLWMAGLLLVLGLGLTVYINAMTAIRVPQAVSHEVVVVELTPTPHPPEEPLSASPPVSPSIGESSAIEQVQEIAIREVRIVSLIGAGIFAVLGAIVAYWMAQQALRPVQRLSLVNENQ